MSTQSPYPAAPVLPAPPKSWMARNWKWFVPMACLTSLLMCAAFVIAIFFFVHSLIIHSDPYRVAAERAEESSQVEVEIGFPLHAGWIVSGQINETLGGGGNAYLRIPIFGPHGKGDIIVDAKREGGKWNYQTLEVDVTGKSDVIPLLRSGEGVAPKPSGTRI
jgi:cytochrome oxidase complex assembly protein 1